MSMRRLQGVTLLEVLLVLAISVAILLFSVRQYQLFVFDRNIQQVRYNVDTIFQAMRGYYGANCTSQQTEQLLPINIKTDLINGHFLVTPLQINQFVYNTGNDWTTGYITQFNISTSTRYSCTNGNCTTQPIGTAVIWVAQVAVKLNPEIANSSNAPAFLAALGGDCLSGLSGSTVAPCGTSSQTDYVVWQRIPSYPSQGTQTDYWVTNPVVTQFNQMYTTYPGGYLMQTEGDTPSGQQFFYCGS